MSWIHSSKALVVGVLLAVSLVSVGTAAAVTVDGSAPAPAEVGQTVSHEVTVEEPFRDAPDQWTLNGQTDLQDPSWTIQVEAQGDPVDTQDISGESFGYDLQSDTGATVVTVEVTGQVPELSTYDYRSLENENYTAISLARGDSEMETFTAHRFTTGSGEEPGSQEARQAIDEAVEAAGGENDKIDQAISAYDNGNFENAVSLADEAQGGAQSSQLLLIAAGVVVVLALVGGGVYYWRQSRDKGHKLQ